MGYPDFQAYAQWRADNLLSSNSLTQPTGTVTYGPFLVSNYAGVLLRFIPSAGYGTVTLRWWLDAAATIGAGTDTWTVNPSTGLAARVPARGFYCTLAVTVASVAAMTAVQTLLPDNNVARTIAYPVTANQVTTGLVTYAISATVFYALPFIQRGLASFMLNPNDTTAKLQADVVTFNADGTLGQYLQRLGLVAGNVNQLVGLTDDPCGIQVINTDAAATHGARITLIPGLSGQG